MSDISDNGSFNLGLANIASSESGPTAITNQNLGAANTQNVQQQAQAQQMQNQIMRARMPLILSGIHDETVGEGDQSGVGAGGGSGVPASRSAQLQEAEERSGTADDSILKPGAIDKALRDKYFVPAVTPQEYQRLIKSYSVDPGDQYGLGPKRVQAMIDMRKQQQTTAATQESRDDFDALHAVTDAPEGQAMNVLRASHPEVYDAIQRKFKGQPDEERNEEDQARLFAAHAAGAVHQYTGRKAVKDDAGVYRDEETGISIPGVEKVGLSTEQYIKLAHEANTASVDVPDGQGGSTKMTPWAAARANGAKNMNGPEDWIMMRASQMGLPGGGATISNNSAQKQEGRAVAKSANATAQQQRAAAGAPANGEAPPVNGISTARNAQGQPDQKLTTALQDPTFRFKPTSGLIGPDGKPQTYTPGMNKTPPKWYSDAIDKQQSSRQQLAKDSNDGIPAASAALTMYQAAQDILAKGRYDGGAWDARLSKEAGKYLPVGWQNAAKTGDYQELAKMLGTAALQSGKAMFAKMTQMEAKMLTNELNPSPSMQPEAMRDMIDKGMRISQYTVDSAKRVPRYLQSGMDADQFKTWNQTHFPMETETKPTAAKPNAAGAAPKFSDEQVRAYMQKHKLQDEKATRKALGM
jgi:hypothetical protein